MKLLAYDTSSDRLTIAIFEGDQQIAELESHSFTRHSSVLVPSLDRLLKENHIFLDQIQVLAVGLGPGSFTGLRVGVTAAKMFAYINKIKIVGVSSLEAMAWEAATFDEDVAVILDAKKEKLYAGVYQLKGGTLKAIHNPRLVGIETLLRGVKKPRLFLGNGVSLYREKILSKKFCQVADHAESVYPKASNIARQAMLLFQKKQFLDPMTMEPLYLHPRDCNVMKK